MPATTINISSSIERVLANLRAEAGHEAEMLREKIRQAEPAGETWLTMAESAPLESF